MCTCKTTTEIYPVTGEELLVPACASTIKVCPDSYHQDEGFEEAHFDALFC